MHSVNSRISGDLQAAGDAVAQKAKSEDDGTRQEVRFAVAMSGGVSLAVWMGGVAREINLLQQASNPRQSENGPAGATCSRIVS